VSSQDSQAPLSWKPRPMLADLTHEGILYWASNFLANIFWNIWNCLKLFRICSISWYLSRELFRLWLAGQANDSFFSYHFSWRFLHNWLWRQHPMWQQVASQQFLQQSLWRWRPGLAMAKRHRAALWAVALNLEGSVGPKRIGVLFQLRLKRVKCRLCHFFNSFRPGYPKKSGPL